MQISQCPMCGQWPSTQICTVQPQIKKPVFVLNPDYNLISFRLVRTSADVLAARATQRRTLTHTLTHAVCKIVLVEFLNCDMSLALTCKHFRSNREEMFSLLQYEKLCASGTPPRYDPFRHLIQAAVPKRILQQILWKQLWTLREVGEEPWDDIQSQTWDSNIDYIYTKKAQLGQEASSRTDYTPWPKWPGRDFKVLTCKEYNILQILEEKNQRVVGSVFNSGHRNKWTCSSEDGIIIVTQENGLPRVWRPNIYRLQALAKKD